MINLGTLYIREEDRHMIRGDGPVRLIKPRELECGAPLQYAEVEFPHPAPGLARTRELADGRVVCMACQHGPCQVPDGRGR